MQENSWELRRGDVLLGTLTTSDGGMFWIYCDFMPTLHFEQFRSLFAQEYQLLDTEGVQDDWENIYARITDLKLSLHNQHEFDDENMILLHIVEQKAWFMPLKGPSSGWVGD